MALPPEVANGRKGFSLPSEGESHGDPGECEVEILTGHNRGLGEGPTFWNNNDPAPEGSRTFGAAED